MKSKPYPSRVLSITSESDCASRLLELIVPAACKSDIDENVPPSVKEGIEFVFVDDARQVLHEVFANEPLLKRLQEHLPLENGEPVRTKH